MSLMSFMPILFIEPLPLASVGRPMRQCRERIGACGVTLDAGAGDRRPDGRTGPGPSNHAGFVVKCRQNFRQVSPDSPSSVVRFCTLGTGIIAAPGPRAPATARPRPHPGRPSRASRPPAQSRCGQGATVRYPSAPATASPAPHPPSTRQRDEAAHHTRQLPILALPTEDLVRVHVVPARHDRYRNPGLVALRHDPALPRLAPATATTANPTVAPGARLLRSVRHPHKCPLNFSGHLRRAHFRARNLPDPRQKRQAAYAGGLRRMHRREHCCRYSVATIRGSLRQPISGWRIFGIRMLRGHWLWARASR